VNPESFTTFGGATCPVCTASALPEIEIPEYRLFRCTDCGCWSSDALVREARTSFEPKHYFENDEADRPRWDELFARLGRRAATLHSILDVGCGTGAFLADAARRAPTSRRCGIEIDPERATRARALDPGAVIHTGDALEVAGRLEGPFALVTLWDVFEHLPDPVALLRELRRTLDETGAIYVQTIHEQSLLPAIGRASHRISGGRITHGVRRTHEAHHLVFFTRAGLALAAERADLRIREQWFGRLDRRRMDGPPLVTAAAAALLAVENALGNGLFVNLLLERRRQP
jgi:2-polyprenyl-3-methyl-5-hydroxy-6-metoxy-1,4-benzoquinol methylase